MKNHMRSFLGSDEPLPEDHVPSERYLKMQAKFRENYIKFITDLGTLTPIEKKFLLSSIYMTSETIDTFLQDQDEVLGLSTEELALIEESAVDKLYAARSHDHNDPIDTRTFFPAEVMDAFVLNPKHVKRRFQQRIKRDAKSRRKRNDK